uniref:Uncharacterized protein n=1 Tax=Anopheles culicifacies TaxID=139723 RepID=A0A182M553_9DIPT
MTDFDCGDVLSRTYLCTSLACRGLVPRLCAGDFCSALFIGDAELVSASDWFSSSSLIDGNAKQGPLFSVSSSASYPSRRLSTKRTNNPFRSEADNNCIRQE